MLFKQESPTLVQIHPGHDESSPKYGSTFVFVPDFDVPSIETWTDASGMSWVHSVLPKICRMPCVLSFEPGIRCHDFQWRDFLEHGDSLLRQLLEQNLRDRDFFERPLVFIAHGLGGSILKRCLGVLFERFFDPTYKGLSQCITGVVFLGCPHPSVNKPSDLKRVVELFRAISKGTERKSQRHLEDVAIVANLCQKFSDAATELPMLSVYETKVSKVGKGIFSPRMMLVDRPLCEITTKRERLLGLASTHEDLVNMGKSPDLEIEISRFTALAFEIRNMTLSSKQRPARRTNWAWDSKIGDPWDSCFSTTSLSSELDSITSQTSLILADRFDVNNDSRISLSNVPSEPEQRNLPCYSFQHERNSTFTGREEFLDQIDEALLPDQGADGSIRMRKVHGFALCGVGGLGKTQLAVEYVHSRKASFDAIFWLNAADPSRLANDFAQIASKLGLDRKMKSQDQTVTRNLVLDWLLRAGSANAKSPVNWLLVFDNSDNLTYLREYWPVADHGSILVTSRDPLAKTQIYIDCPNGVDLHPFSVEDSAAWLRQLIRIGDDDEDIALSLAIAKELSGLPLAISRVAGAIQRQSLSLPEFLKFYRDDAFRAQVYQAEYGAHQVPLWATFAFQELSRKASSVLELISFMDPDSIPETLFTNFIEQKRQKAHLEGFPDNILQYIEARTELIRCSLLRRNVSTQELAVHRIVQDSAMVIISKERLVMGFEFVLGMIIAAWPSYRFQNYDPERWKASAPLLPHIGRLRKQYEMFQTLQESSQCNLGLGKLLAEAAWYQIECGNPQESIRLLELATTLLEEAPTVNKLYLAYAYQVHSQAANICGMRDVCLKKAYQSLEILDEFTETGKLTDQHHCARAWAELSEALVVNRQYEKSIEAAKQAMALFDICFKQQPDEPLFVSEYAVCARSFALWRLGGEQNLAEASRLLLDCLTIKRRFYGDAATYGVGHIMTHLGNIRYTQGLLLEALDLFRDAFRQIVATVGKSDKAAAALSTKIGLLYQRKGNLVKAKDCYLDALSIYSNRVLFKVESTWTSFLLVHVMEKLGDPMAPETRQRTEFALLELSLKLGRRLEEDLREHLAPWAILDQ